MDTREDKQSIIAKPDVIIIGAGPVGLWTAIQLKLHDPKTDILMFEKYTEYKRRHILLLDKTSLIGTHNDPEFQKLIQDLPTKIRTTELESKLLQFAKQQGLNIQYKKVENFSDLPKQFPSAKVIVGADGAHSKTREEIFDGNLSVNKNLKFIAELKYECKGSANELNLWTEAVPALAYTKHLVSEFVGKEKNGKTPVSLRLFIDEKAYNQMQEARGGTYFSLKDTDKINSDLLISINAWLKARKMIAKENRIPDSEKITVTKLAAYRSEAFVRQVDGTAWCLVGDAAFGVPYFRSLNNGLISGTNLAKKLAAHLKPEIVEPSKSSLSFAEKSPLEEYSDFVSSLSNKQIRRAKVKSKGVSTLESSASSIQTMPVTNWKLPRNYKQAMRREEEKQPENHKSSLARFSKFSSFEDSNSSIEDSSPSCTIL